MPYDPAALGLHYLRGEVDALPQTLRLLCEWFVIAPRRVGSTAHTDCFEAAVRDRAWPSALIDVGREAELGLLLDWERHGVLPRRDLAPSVAQAWVMTHAASMMDDAELVELFRAADYLDDHCALLADWSGGHLAAYPTCQPEPNRPLTVYRGARRGAARRPAWTSERAVAEHSAPMAERPGKKGCVYQATIAPDAVLAQFNTRSEQEVVVDPAGLRDLHRAT